MKIRATPGWTISDGVDGRPGGRAGSRNVQLHRSEGRVLCGARLGFVVTPNVEVGFLFTSSRPGTSSAGRPRSNSATWRLQLSRVFRLQLRRVGRQGATVRAGGARDDSVRRGLRDRGQPTRNLGGVTSRFSSTWGGGLKLQTSDRVSLRLEGRWTPTFIKSDSEGWWCDPYWGCYVVADAQYANQFELSGGSLPASRLRTAGSRCLRAAAPSSAGARSRDAPGSSSGVKRGKMTDAGKARSPGPK